MFFLKKKYGQVVLKNKQLLLKIINLSQIKEDSYVIEIGTGFGYLTNLLSEHLKNGKLLGIEIDQEILKISKKIISKKNNFKILNIDVLKLKWRNLVFFEFQNLNKKIDIIGNLPYNISSKIIFNLLLNFDLFKSFTFTLQKELVDRLLAEPSKNSKNYSALSVMMRFYTTTRLSFKINASSFNPRPLVESMTVSFSVQPKFFLLNQKIFWKFVFFCFKKKRKTLINNLLDLSLDKNILLNIFQKLNKNYFIRAEELSWLDFYLIFQELLSYDQFFFNFKKI
jgi:16S rRNA (adenine1518-N6/adenine1519-N6)-dimethyltransferase